MLRRVTPLIVPMLLATLAWETTGCSDENDAVDVATAIAATNPGVASAPSFPLDNPPSAAKADLGRLLFWDPILSGDRDVACATCHHPDFAYADGRKLSLGTGSVGVGPARRVAGTALHQTTRNSMTVLNAAWNGRTSAALPSAESAPMFWDDRVRSLETQAMGPTSALDEMRGAAFDATTIFPELVTRLKAIPAYATAFETAFAGEGITEETIVRAVATFERTLVDTGSSYDRYAAGDGSAMSASQVHGLAVFTRSGCIGCHSGPMFSDFTTHRVASRRGGTARSVDDGAGGGVFRTASLRNVARTAPYMHDGAFTSLDDVLDLYRNVDDSADPKLRALRVPGGSDRRDLIAFLQALSDGTFDRTIPADVPSGLPVGGALR